MRTLHALPATLVVATAPRQARSHSRAHQRCHEVSYSRTQHTTWSAIHRVELLEFAGGEPMTLLLPQLLSVARPHHDGIRRGSYCQTLYGAF